jgi:hypothetical protein
MKKLQWKTKHWVALGSILLVLVGTGVAYSVYVPKVRELEKAQQDLDSAQKSRDDLAKRPLPKVVSEEEKKSLAVLVPVSLDQSRFLKTFRERAEAAGVTIKSLDFSDGNPTNADAPAAGTSKDAKDPKAAAAPPAVPAKPAPTAGKTDPAKPKDLEEHSVKLSLQGSYSQVRKFIESFSKIDRMITFTKWGLSTESNTVYAKVSNVVSSQHLGNSQTPDASLLEEVRNNQYLRDRTPIYTDQEKDRVLELIAAQHPVFHNQHERDIANLEIQQTHNRYIAGLLKKPQALSILDQDVVGVIIPLANPRVREVFGLQPASQPDAATPLPLLQNPDQTVEGSQVTEITVKLDLTFTIYSVPSAHDLLPASDAIKTYDPTMRTNPVEPW